MGTSVSHAKVAELIEIPFWEQTWMNSSDDDMMVMFQVQAGNRRPADESISDS